jgi:hypothetical protein
MALCPLCNHPNAYNGFNSIECRNRECEHFVLVEEIICPCCGRPNHLATEECAGAPAADPDPAADPAATAPATSAQSSAGKKGIVS